MKRPIRYIFQKGISSRVLNNRRITIIEDDTDGIAIEFVKFVGKEEQPPGIGFIKRGCLVSYVNLSKEAMEELIFLYCELKNQRK